MIVTIDGPAGTGKSTAARQLAERLGFQYLDTGAMYRMVALQTHREGIDPHDERAVARIAASLEINFSDGLSLLNGEDVSSLLRTPEVTLTASIVAQNGQVREVLVDRQRALAERRNIVCEGRDQGTVVFPDAEFKFFLTADPSERARRRLHDLKSAGKAVDFQDLLREQAARDERDEKRLVAPLAAAPDATLVDTTSLSVEEVVTLLRNRVIHQQETEG